MKRVFPQLDGLRAVAAMMVVIHHIWPGSVRWDPTGGRLAVDVFFVLSGYLITRTLLRSRQEAPDRPLDVMKRFHLRRLLRIMPVYYVTLVLAWQIPSERSPAMLWHAAFLSNLYFILQGHYVGADAHLWALAVEQHFYLFWPFAVLFLSRRYLMKAAGTMIAAGLLFRWVGGMASWTNVTLDVMTPAAFEALGMGACLACWMESREASPCRGDGWISGLGIAGLALWALRTATAGLGIGYWCALLFTEFSRSLVLTWLIAQAVWGIPGWIGRVLESTPARALGSWSYAIYMSHNYFFAIFKARPYRLGPLSVYNSQAILALAATLAWSMACNHLIEKPLVKPNTGMINT